MKKCHRCGKPTESSRCESCVKIQSDTYKRVRKDRSSSGFCVTCGETPEKDKKSCLTCLLNNKARNQKMRLKRFNNNLCTYCGKDVPDKDFRCCRSCLDKCEKLVETIRTELIAKGICTCCRKNKYLNSMEGRSSKYRFCLECYMKHCSTTYMGSSKHYKELLNKLEQQNYICPYSGETIIVGDNSSIDHILPGSRFPELKKDIKNLQWVSFLVNKMKFNQTEEEFKILIKKIHDHLKL